MDEQQIIQQFFKNETTAVSYVRNRLLGDFDKAPPPISDRFIEEFPTDLLQRLVDDLEDTTIFWNACFQLFKEWRDPDKADPNRAKGLYELTYMIRQFNHHHEEVFGKEKERWQEELNTRNLGESPYAVQEKNLVYAQNLNLVHIWNLWSDERWIRLYENILRASSENNEAQFELMLIVTQHLKWDAGKTMQLFKWALDRGNLPKTFYNQYFLHRLRLCGNRMTETNIEEQKRGQRELVNDILKTQGQLFYSLPNEQKMTLGKALREASELFDLKSFKCLDLDERKRSLLGLELAKLIQPPTEKETNMRKTDSPTPSGVEYMNNNYVAARPLAA